MNKLNCLISIFLILSDNLAHPSRGSHQPHSISAILKSYANAFTTIKPRDIHQFTSPSLHNVKIRDSRNIYNFTPVKSEERAHTLVPDYLNVEPNDTNLDVKRSIDLHTASDENSNIQDPKGPPDHIIPYSEHENPKEPQTRPNYTSPGEWAKPPLDKNISLDFVPSKLYAQVRGTHTVEHLPREEAIKNAETDEEKNNAARLKEVVKISKANTVYTEEGYEDAAYDHAGQIRDADFHEGFARKLSEDLEKRYKRKKGKNIKNHKPRKNRSEHVDDDHIDHLEETEEARISKQKVKPEDLKVLKSALNKSIIDPKKVALSGISSLERDLEKESEDAERASATEPYYPTTTGVPVTESLSESKIVYETTTAKHDVFTVRPRKLTTTIKPPSHLAKIKIPARYFSTAQNNYNNHVSHHRSSENPLSISYGDPFQRYSLNGHNQVSGTTYRPIYFESQTVNPVIANPLAVATVNGHGPYLFVVSSPPNTLIPNAQGSQGSETTIPYATAPIENVTKPPLTNPYRRQDSFLPLEHRKVENTRTDYSPESHVKAEHHTPRIFDEEGEFESEEENKTEDEAIQFSKFETPTNGLFFKDEEKKNLYHYSGLKPPRPSNAFVKYSDFNLPERKPLLPVTRLLPPAPLSVSEYTSFYMRDRKNDPLPASVMAVMPIIETIRKKEQRFFPFLFRKRRSIIDSANKQGTKQQKNGYSDNKNSSESSFFKIKKSAKKFPREFGDLLNSSPDIASTSVNKEIENRFRNSSSKETEEDSQEPSIFHSKEKIENHKDLGNGESVEIDVPEIDFSSVFEEDDDEPAIKKPGINTTKYPYYENNRIARNTALKYIVNPLEIPRKTFGGMEFYNSRKLECEEIDPNLEKIVPEEKLQEKSGPRKTEKKLHGLGDKLDCYKAKYFDENPLDNPIFIEDRVESPSPPIELDPKLFASKILELPTEKVEYVIQRGPKNPEELVPNRRRLPTIGNIPRNNRNHWDRNKSHDSQPRKVDSQRFYNIKNRGLLASNVEQDTRFNKNQTRKNPRGQNSKVAPAYQQHVYEDVMGTIINLENFHRRPILKRGSSTHVYPKHRIRQSSEDKGIGSFDSTKNSHLLKIDGLVPPSRNMYKNFPHKNNKFLKSKSRDREYSSHEKPNSHIFKRHVDISEFHQIKTPSDNNTSTSAFEKTEKSTFRIVLTTPIPEKRKKKQNTVMTVINSPTTQKIIPVTENQMENSTLSSRNDRRYGKFVDAENITSSVDSRRKEPRYRILNPRRKIEYMGNSTPFNNSELTIIPRSIVDPPFSGSTLIPIIVKPDKVDISRIPEETKSYHTKKRIEQFGTDRPEGTSRAYLEDINTAVENHDNLEKRGNLGGNGNKRRKKSDNLKNYVTVDPDVREHKELLNFLKGDPPGYAKAFAGENITGNEESESKESLQNEESRNSPNEEIVEKSDEDDRSQENNKNLDNSDDIDEESNNEEDSRETHHQPFERYSDRPFSPPENFEDDKYSNLGPRINKPYFYHPPFEVPDYEKRKLEKTVDHSDDSDYNHSVGTEDVETYVFPWEEDKEEEIEEVNSSLDRYEYPWEKRERKEKERKRREKLKKKHDEIYNFSEEEEDGREATNTKPVYIIPSDTQHPRDKKSVNKMDYSSKNVPRSRFNNEYKSGVVELPFEDEDMSISVADNDEIRDSVLEYLTKNESSKPKVKSKTFQKSILNDTYVVSTSEDSPLELKNKNTTTETLNPEYVINSTILPDNITISNKTKNPISRIQSRNVRIKNISSRTDNTNKSSDQIMASRMSSTTSPTRIKKRGHLRGSFANIATTTSFPSETNTRRRRLTVKNATVPLSSNDSRVHSSRRIPSGMHTKENKIAFPVKNMRRKSITYPNVPTSTGKTVEHRSRVSKEEIITKTIYPDEEDDDGHTKIEEISPNHDNEKLASENVPTKSFQIKRKSGPRNDTQDGQIKKKQKVEKVTITMEETPGRVYRTKEIDKDGVKGKFVTIIANNNSVAQRNSHDDNLHVSDAEMEAMKNRFHTLDSTIQENENLENESSEDSATKNYLLGKLLQNSPLPANQKSGIISKNGNNTSNKNIKTRIEDEDEGENEDEDEDEDEDGDEDEDDYDDEEDYVEDDGDDKNQENDDNDKNDEYKNRNTESEKSADDNSDRESNNRNKTEKSEKNQTVIETTIAPNTTEITTSTVIIKDPSDRQYFYVEQR